MSVAVRIKTLALGKRLRRLLWTHPEWWILLLVALAWGMLVRDALASQGHGHPSRSFQAEFGSWCVMVVAMMLPLMLEPLRWLAFQSFRHRRHRAMLLFLAGFLVPWMLVGVVAAWVRTRDGIQDPLFASGMFALAALWVLVPLRARALVSCQLTIPLAPSGWDADRDCVRYSLLLGRSCVVTCGVMMLACTLTGHNLVAMLGGAVLGVLERRSYRPPTYRLCAGALLLAIWVLLPARHGMLP